MIAFHDKSVLFHVTNLEVRMKEVLLHNRVHRAIKRTINVTFNKGVRALRG